MLTCDEAEIELSAYLDGELTPQERAAVEAHMVLCANCNAVLNEIEFARKSLTSMPKLSAPPALAARLKNALREDASRGSAIIKAPSTHNLRAVQQIYELAEFGAPPPLVPVPLKRVFPWSAMFSAVAAMLMVGLMGYVALAPSVDRIASLTEDIASKAKGDSHAKWPDRATTAAAPVPPPQEAEKDTLRSGVGRESARKNADAAPMAKGGRPDLSAVTLQGPGNPLKPFPDAPLNVPAAAKRTEEFKKQLPKVTIAGQESRPGPVEIRKAAEAPEGADAAGNAAPFANKKSSPQPVSPAAPAPEAAANQAQAPAMDAAPSNRALDRGRRLGAGAEKESAASDKSPALGGLGEGGALGGGSKSRGADTSIDLANALAAQQVIRIRTKDVAQTSTRLAEISRKLNAELNPAAESDKAKNGFTLVSTAARRSELLNALYALQAEGSKDAMAEKAKAVKPGAAVAAKEKLSEAAKLDEKAPGDAKFSVRVELIAE